MISHLSRQNKCEARLQDIDPTVLLQELQSNNYTDAFKFSCSSCDKRFKSRQALHYHRKTIHMDENDTDTAMQRMKNEIMKELAAMGQGTNTNTTNNTSNTNIGHQQIQNNHYTYNINVAPVQRNDFGNESIDHISTDMIKNYILQLGAGTVAMFLKMHFDPLVPENHNIVNLSSKKKRVGVVENNKWVVMDYKIATDQAIRKINNLKFQHFMDLKAEDPSLSRNEQVIMDHHQQTSALNTRAHYKLHNDMVCKIQNNTDKGNNPMSVDMAREKATAKL